MRHKPTGLFFANRKEAKDKMGHSSYNKSLKNREFEFNVK